MSKYKYVTEKEYYVQSLIFGYSVDHQYFSLSTDGVLRAKIGYAWDGMSVVPDTPAGKIPSLFHDVLYQMMRLELIPRKERGKADRLFYDSCKLYGMNPVLALICYIGVIIFGAHYTYKENTK